MLPIYFETKYRKLKEQTFGNRHFTLITKIDGDLTALENDLRQLLGPLHADGPLLIQTDEVTRRIRIEGIYLDQVSEFLVSKGF